MSILNTKFYVILHNFFAFLPIFGLKFSKASSFGVKMCHKGRGLPGCVMGWVALGGGGERLG